jgi:hypothetical protein
VITNDCFMRLDKSSVAIISVFFGACSRVN